MSGNIQESFNSEEAKKAFEEANVEIQELLNKYQQQSSTTDEALNSLSKDAAIGGNLGTVARNTHEEIVGKSFGILKNNISNFMQNRVENIIKDSVNMEEEARNTYAKTDES